MISVIVPTYCSAAFLEETLRSVFAQSLLPAEIIVVDDCSPDETSEVVKTLRSHSPIELRLIQLEQNSGGPVIPMNRGIQEARGEFIAMLDHDDRMVPQRLELGATLLATSDNLGLAFGQSQVMNEHGILEPPRPQAYTRFGNTPRTFCAPEAFNSLITEGFGYGGAGGMMFRKAAWEQIGGFRPIFKICWDYDFAIRTTLAGWDVGYIPEVVYHHRLHQNNLEMSGDGKNLYLEIAKLFEDISKDPRLTQEQRRALQKLRVGRAMTAAQQQRTRGNHRTAQQFYYDAWCQQYQRLQVLRGMIKNWWLSMRKP